MWVLSVDRSGAQAGAALFCNGRLAGECRDAADPSRSPGWLASVAVLLAEHGVAASRLGALCAGVGPGSFSGIRSSLAALQGMALPEALPVLGVSSAAALAFRLLSPPGAPEAVAVVGDARRERLWTATFRLAPQGGVAVVAPGGAVAAARHTAEDFRLCRAADIATAVPEGVPVVTADWARIGAQLVAAFGPKRVAAEALVAGAAAVGRLCLAAPAAARRDPLPVYLHPAVAKPSA